MKETREAKQMKIVPVERTRKDSQYTVTKVQIYCEKYGFRKRRCEVKRFDKA
jgi:hypothetical protein